MQFFDYMEKKDLNEIFYIEPSKFYLDSPKQILSYALGATLYMPATMQNIARDIISSKFPGLKSYVLCMEDAIDDSDIQTAQENLFSVFKQLEMAIEQKFIDLGQIPMIFIRVKDVQSFERIIENYKNLSFLSGFVFPKFSSNNGEQFFKRLRELNSAAGKVFYGLPILESREIIYIESRTSELIAIKGILDKFCDIVLNIRIGATDLSGVYSIRREFDQTIYDIAVINSCISNVINVFLRSDSEYVVSAPVWEYFKSGDRLLKPLLRQSAFSDEMGKEGLEIRSCLINQYIDGLIKETLLDKANGLVGKTIIHPTHIPIVNGLQVVTKEEYEDAKLIVETGKRGAVKSTYNNKMNEPKPHMNWAKKILIKASIFGVLNDGHNYTSLFKLD